MPTGGSEVQFWFYLSAALDGEEGWSATRPGRFTSPVKTVGTFCGGWLGGLQSGSGRMRKTSPPTGTRSPGRGEALYRLSYLGPQIYCEIIGLLIVLNLQLFRTTLRRMDF